MTRIRWTGAFLAVCACLSSLAQTDAQVCHNLPRNVEKMLQGVDITEFDIFPMQNTGSHGYKKAVLKPFTCNNQQNGDKADQMSVLTSNPTGELSDQFSLYKSHHEVRQRMTNEVGGGGSIWKFAFSAASSFTEMQDSITNHSRYISDVAAFDYSTEVMLRSSEYLQLNSDAETLLKDVTEDFTTNPGAYNNFISEYGTHYFNSANFGGYIRVLFETNSKYFHLNSDNDAENNAQASLWGLISVNGRDASHSTTVDTSFSKETTHTIKYFGGSANLLAGSGIAQWQPSVDTDPWLCSGELKPISDLIKDPTQKASMEKAVANYVMQKYLAELERLVNTGKTKTSDPILGSLYNKIHAIKTKTILIESEVASLGTEVEYQVVVPSWFTVHTELCFKWRADGDSRQCSSQPTGQPCAKPNDMTPFYRDDTDHRGGGCRMSWGIQTVGHESWLNAVQICYQWKADGDIGQCGGQSSGNYCAGINEFTTEYRDDSDRRRGGCQMSWKLVVPSSAPLWMKKTKLCFHWQADGDAGQCSGPSNDLCAYPNEWTAFYRDDTDRRGGGCKLSWGLKSDFLPH